jgi:dihydrofolate reductase
MGTIVVTENITLDGVIQHPTGEEGVGGSGWAEVIGDADRGQWAKTLCAEALGAEALLLGRRSYEYFVRRWPSRSGTWGDRLNSMPKYVVSATLDHPVWNNSTVLRGDVPEAVAALKRAVAGEIVVYASGTLARALLAHGLVDEVRLIVYPVVVGAGDRLFAPVGDGLGPMRLAETRTVGDGLALLTYRIGAGR